MFSQRATIAQKDIRGLRKRDHHAGAAGQKRKMKISHKGHLIDVRREECLGGWKMLYFSVFRESDLYECTSGFSDSSETVRDYVNILKKRIDNELQNKDPWQEKSRPW